MHQSRSMRKCYAAQARRVERVLARAYNSALVPVGLTVAQLDLLESALAAAEPIRPADLARQMLLDPSTVSRNLKCLRRGGLLRLETGANAREQIVVITPAGRRAVARALPIWRRVQIGVARVLGAGGTSSLRILAKQIQVLAKEGH